MNIEERKKEFFKKFGDVRRWSIIRENLDTYDIWEFIEDLLAENKKEMEEIKKDAYSQGVSDVMEVFDIDDYEHAHHLALEALENRYFNTEED